MTPEQEAEQYWDKNWMNVKVWETKNECIRFFLAGYDKGRESALTPQPMETAPKDGTEIFARARFSKRWQVIRAMEGDEIEFDYWLPLPSKPEKI